MHHFYRGRFFDFEAIRILSTACYGGAEVGEFLEAIGQIREDDPLSWHKAWSEQAEKAECLAQAAQRDGNRVAARSAFLRASNYTRASGYMMTGGRPGTSDPRVVPILHKAVELFHSAIRLFDGAVHILQIPYQDGLNLPAYLYLPPPSCRLPGKTPVMVNCIGADSIQEEIYYMFPAAGPELGYAVLTFEGPGQGLTLHEHDLPMRPDWEAVNGVVMDYLFQFAQEHQDLELDLNRVAVAGTSLGGYLALRAAADPRCKACVAVDPLYDLYDFATKHVAPTFFGMWQRNWVPDGVVNVMMMLGTRLSFQTRWEIFTSCRFLGASTPVELLRIMKTFTLRQAKGISYLDAVVCPVLVTGAADSLYFAVDDHTALAFNALQDPGKEVWIGATPGEGSLQAKMGAMALCNQRAFAFLDRRFGIARGSL